MPSDETQLAVMNTKLDRANDDIKEIKKMLESNYVTQEQFRPVRVFVYGLIAIALTSIGFSVINLIIKR